MEGQGKVEIAGFVSQLPLFKLVVTKMRFCSYDGALSSPKALQAQPVKKDSATPPCAFLGSVADMSGFACHRHGFAVLLRSTAFET